MRSFDRIHSLVAGNPGAARTPQVRVSGPRHLEKGQAVGIVEQSQLAIDELIDVLGRRPALPKISSLANVTMEGRGL